MTTKTTAVLFGFTSVASCSAENHRAPKRHSFRQGCYIGQESISRVNAYNAVKTSLYGVAFEESASLEEGAALVVEETGERQVLPQTRASRITQRWFLKRADPLALFRFAWQGCHFALKQGVALRSPGYTLVKKRTA